MYKYVKSSTDNPWINYGDVNYLDYGALLMRPESGRSDTEFEVIYLVENPDDEDTVYAEYGTVDMSDDWLQKYIVSAPNTMEAVEEAFDRFGLGSYIEFALNSFDSDGQASAWAHYGSPDNFLISKSELAPQLHAMGVV